MNCNPKAPECQVAAREPQLSATPLAAVAPRAEISLKAEALYATYMPLMPVFSVNSDVNRRILKL